MHPRLMYFKVVAFDVAIGSIATLSIPGDNNIIIVDGWIKKICTHTTHQNQRLLILNMPSKKINSLEQLIGTIAESVLAALLYRDCLYHQHRVRLYYHSLHEVAAGETTILVHTTRYMSDIINDYQEHHVCVYLV